jgi:hypothetical protein
MSQEFRVAGTGRFAAASDCACERGSQCREGSDASLFANCKRAANHPVPRPTRKKALAKAATPHATAQARAKASANSQVSAADVFYRLFVLARLMLARGIVSSSAF